MRALNYVTVDAHIISCRLHHNNNSTYSVGLKSAKDQQVQTGFKAAENMIINMDTHLTLQVDKHAYEHFPKVKFFAKQFTLIVNVLTANKERKTVGTTFANFKKEGLQTFQVSECSCKDKAFEVDICFTSKINQVKNSNGKNKKKQALRPVKQQFSSHQGTPRSSRDLRGQLHSRKPKQLQKVTSPIKQTKIHQVRSEMLAGSKKPVTASSKRVSGCEKSPQQQLSLLYQKIKLLEIQLESLQPLKRQFQLQKLNCSRLSELLQVQQQKNILAMAHIKFLEGIFHETITKSESQMSKECANNFKIIQQEDQILLLNQQLHVELERQKSKTLIMSEQIMKLKVEVQELTVRLRELHQKYDFQKNPEVLLGSREKSNDSKIEIPNQILISSRCKEPKESDIKHAPYRKQLIQPIQYQRSRTSTQIVPTVRDSLEKQISKKVSDKGKNTPNISKNPPTAQPGHQKFVKNIVKEKPSKLTSVKGQDSSRLSSRTSFQVDKTKKSLELQASDTVCKTRPSNEMQTETEGAQQIRKSISSGIKEVKSEVKGNYTTQTDYIAKSTEG